MRNKSGSILLVSLWILLILTVFSLGLGHRSSIALRLSAYQRDSLKASYSARAGINQAIQLLKYDAIVSPKYNSLKSTWSTEKNLRIIDEERKININKMSDPLSQPLGGIILKRLFESAEVEGADGLTSLVIKWINFSYDSVDDPDRVFKNSPLQAVEEIVPVLVFFYKDGPDPALRARDTYARIKDIITVYGDGRINMNTVSEEVLLILVNAGIDKCVDSGCINSWIPPDNLTHLIIKIREDYILKDSGDLSNYLESRGISTDEENALGELPAISKFKSDCFRINSTGVIPSGNMSRMVSCVFSRVSPQDKILYWHEN